MNSFNIGKDEKGEIINSLYNMFDVCLGIKNTNKKIKLKDERN